MCKSFLSWLLSVHSVPNWVLVIWLGVLAAGISMLVDRILQRKDWN